MQQASNSARANFVVFSHFFFPLKHHQVTLGVVTRGGRRAPRTRRGLAGRTRSIFSAGT